MVEIYRRLRPGETPSVDTARALFDNLFFKLQAVRSFAGRASEVEQEAGPRSAVGTADADGAGHGRGDPLSREFEAGQGRNRRHRPPGQSSCPFGRRVVGEPIPTRAGPHGAQHQGADEPAGYGDGVAARFDQCEARRRRSERVLQQQPIVAVHGPNESARRNYAQAAAFRARSRRVDQGAGGVRSSRRPSFALQPYLSDRNAGRPEHRLDHVAGDLCAHQ